MTLPPDPAAFIAAAERGINARDLEATVGAYAEHARVEAITDGAWEAYDGAEAIRRAWAAYLDAFGKRDFTLRKSIVSVTGDLIVNDWTGTFGGAAARGIEHWLFDAEGQVAHHRLYSFLNVQPSTTLRQRARLAVAYPLGAVAFLAAQKRAGARPGR